MLSRILFGISGGLCLALASCIEGEEQIWLNADGSGRVEARYKMPSAVAKRIGEPAELVRVLQEAADEGLELVASSRVRDFYIDD